MAYNKERMLFNRTPKPVILQVPVKCTICDQVNNEVCPIEIHDGTVEVMDIKVVGIPWARKNYIKSQCVSFDDQQQTHFDSQQYISECLKIMIVEAEWGNTDEIFLMQVGDELGAALEKLVPSAYVAEEIIPLEESFSEIKKE